DYWSNRFAHTRWPGLAFNGKTIADFEIIRRKTVTQSCGFHSSHRADSLDELSVILGDLLVAVIPRARQSEMHCQYVIGLESGADVLQFPEALDHQSSADQEHHRERYFGHCESALHSTPAGAVSAASAAFLEGLVEIQPGALQCGRKPEYQTANGCDQ